VVDETIRREIVELRREIERHNELYYGEDNPEISDQQFDGLLHRLAELEMTHPECVLAGSPTQRVGTGDLVEGFEKRSHVHALLSLANAYSRGDIDAWEQRLSRVLSERAVSFVCESKLDGLSIALYYEAGTLVAAVTRGDGKVGEDVTSNLVHVAGVPRKLSEPMDLCVRGEVVMPRREFERLNREAEEAGGTAFANPRNAAAGTIRQLDSAVVASRRLSCYVYDILGRRQGSHFEQLQELTRLGFLASPDARRVQTLAEAWDFIDALGERRFSLNFDIDGAVIKVDDLETRDLAGATAKAPRWALAYKYQAERAETWVRDVVFQVGRTGVITPVAEFEPVRLSGSLVSRASLHNFHEINRKGVCVGSRVLVEKAGEIIPQVVQVIGVEPGQLAREVVEPTQCPVCEHELARREGEVALRCSNAECPAQLQRSLEHFLGRSALDADGFGPAIIAQLIERGLVKQLADLFILEPADFLSLRDAKDKMANKLYKSLVERRDISLNRFLMGLGIDFVGSRAASILAERYGSVEELMAASRQELEALDGVGVKTATSILAFFSEPGSRARVLALLANGVRPRPAKLERVSSALEGLKVVVTGTLSRYARKEVEGVLKRLGAAPAGSVSKKTDAVVVGENAGSKAAKARALGVRIIDEAEFYCIVDSAGEV